MDRSAMQGMKDAARVVAPYAVALAVTPRGVLDGAGCGPASEGGIGCQVMGGWVPWITAVCLVGIVLSGVQWLALTALPDARRRWQAGERIRLRRPVPSAELASDPLLAAASWAHVTHAQDPAGVTAAFGWARAIARPRRRAEVPPPVTPQVLDQRAALRGTGTPLTLIEGGAEQAASREPVVRVVEAQVSRSGLAGLSAVLGHVREGDAVVAFLVGDAPVTPGGVASLRRVVAKATAEGVAVVLVPEATTTASAVVHAGLAGAHIAEDRTSGIDLGCDLAASGERVAYGASS